MQACSVAELPSTSTRTVDKRRDEMTPAQQKNVELIHALRKELKNISIDIGSLMKHMGEGAAGRREVGNASMNVVNARVALKDALGEIGREEYQREEED
jgi:hypothetical protein